MATMLSAATMLQAVVGQAGAQAGPSWQNVAMVILGLLQALVFLLYGQSLQDRRELHRDLEHVKKSVTVLRERVGVDGNGLLARMDEMASDMREVRDELREIAVQLAKLGTK